MICCTTSSSSCSTICLTPLCTPAFTGVPSIPITVRLIHLSLMTATNSCAMALPCPVVGVTIFRWFHIYLSFQQLFLFFRISFCFLFKFTLFSRSFFFFFLFSLALVSSGESWKVRTEAALRCRWFRRQFWSLGPHWSSRKNLHDSETALLGGQVQEVRSIWLHIDRSNKHFISLANSFFLLAFGVLRRLLAFTATSETFL